MILLFDAMGTIVRDPIVEEVPAFFEMRLEELIAQLSYEAWVEFEKNAIDEAEFRRRFFKDGRDWDYDGLVTMLGRTYRYIDGMEALLAELAATDTPMHILSNYPSWYRVIEERLALTRYLPWTFVSCDTGVRKPDRDAYLNAARTLGASPRDCLLIDDRRDNVTAARAVDMQAIEFRGVDDLRTRLRLAQPSAGTE